jgi:phospholipase/lecithinase/hemolysin
LGDGITTVTDGTGYNGAITNAVLFLKQATANNLIVASIPDLLITEDAINTLTTESGDQISEEDF